MIGRGLSADLVILDEPYRMPARQWDAPEPVEAEPPTVVVSSRDCAPAPRVGAAVRLEAAAVAAGWRVRQTYALASIPERRFANGNVAKAAHMLATVAVRMCRRIEAGWQFGYAMWRNEDDHGWRFSHAFVGLEQVGARSIVEALK